MIKRFLNYLTEKSWRTLLLGLFAILLGLHSARVLWVPTQTIWFNLIYVIPGPMALIITGWGLLHARDHRTK